MSDKEKYNVVTEAFQGPLDLLLHLIEKRKMHISDVSLSQIADDYIAYLEKMEKFSLKSSADFILTASILMLIKSKSLLPELDLNQEERRSIEDLENRLKEYQKIKQLSLNVERLFAKKIIFFRQYSKKREIIFSPDKNFKVGESLFLIKNLIRRIPKKVLSPKAIVDKIIALEDVIDDLSNRINSVLKMSFNEYSGLNTLNNSSKEKKVNVVISFLAMLELVKQGAISVKQDSQFGDIDMDTQEVSIPNYMERI